MGRFGEMNEAVPAATVILLRDAPGGVETLMLRRNSKLDFAGGMWVFPGGRVDPDDADPNAPDDPVAAARRCAARESAEEAAAELDPTEFVTLSSWCPPPEAPKRFDTWFFVARAPAGDIKVDGGEIHDHHWSTPAEVLDRSKTGEIEILPPTWISLDALLPYETVTEALATIEGSPTERFETRMLKTDGMRTLAWFGDAAYETGDTELAGPRHRMVLDPAGWRYDRHD